MWADKIIIGKDKFEQKSGFVSVSQIKSIILLNLVQYFVNFCCKLT